MIDFDVIGFSHKMRQAIVEATGNDQLLVRFVVEAKTPPNTITFEVVSIGKTILPFVMDRNDFNDIPLAEQFIINAVHEVITESSDNKQ